MRLYVSVKTPSYEHKMLVSFNLKSYIRIWFKIKKSKYLTDGPGQVFEVIISTSFLLENLLRVVVPVVERNAFLIVEARMRASKIKSLRYFQPPKINFQATDYTEFL